MKEYITKEVIVKFCVGVAVLVTGYKILGIEETLSEREINERLKSAGEHYKSAEMFFEVGRYLDARLSIESCRWDMKVLVKEIDEEEGLWIRDIKHGWFAKDVADLETKILEKLNN